MSNIWTNEYNPFQKWKVLAWHDRLIAIKNSQFKAPVNIALDILQGTQLKKKCGQFKCNFCMSNIEDIGQESVIPDKDLLSLPKFFSDWGVKSLCIAGHHSDFTMYNHLTLIKFLELCSFFKLEVGVVSNGAYFSKSLIEASVKYCTWSGWSVNAGTAKTHNKITSTNTFDKIIENIKYTSKVRDKVNPLHSIGYKYLITDDNYMEILEAVKIAKDIGVNHFQIRPTQLPIQRSNRIDVEEVNNQILQSLQYERKGEFEIFGIREKFTSEFEKITPKRCIASPLGSTWKADGDVVICPDRRWSANQFKLGNFLSNGVESIYKVWGNSKHIKMIENINKDIQNCIRCTSFCWHDIYENCIEKDRMNVSLI